MPKASSATRATQTGKTILVVDDNAENLYLIGSLLQPHYQVRVANGGAVALDVARRAPCPDLILLDIMMPEIDGYEVLRRLRAAPETADIPVIFVTAMDADADEARGLSMGAVDYITKPVVPALLLARVRTRLELKDARDWLRERNAVLAAEVGRQVVELTAAKEAAEAASLSKSRFIDSMTHELRDPMNGVMGMLQLAQTEVLAGSVVFEYLKIALDSSRAMVDQLDAILEYANIAHGETKLHEQQVDIAALLEHATGSWRRQIEEKGLQFELTWQLGTPETINGDEGHLKRILALLLSNAVKFTAHGHVELGVEATHGGVHFWVRDSGIGIAMEKQQGIFHPFEQVDNSRTREYGGAGLGLATAMHLVTLMGGSLWVDSTPGIGSTFHLTLPERPGN